jgi:septum formation protein
MSTATLSRSTPLLLASGSPRRRALLESAGIPLVVRPADVDEAERAHETPEAYAERVVTAKMQAARAQATGPFAAILVADTIVVCDGRVLGKPSSRDEAIDIVTRLSGRAHEVKTRFALERIGGRADRAQAVARTVVTEVHVRALPRVWIERYADTKEGFDKAGSYAVQGRFAFAIERIVGSYTNVVGLPLCEVVQALDDLGLLGDVLLS